MFTPPADRVVIAAQPDTVGDVRAWLQRVEDAGIGDDVYLESGQVRLDVRVLHVEPIGCGSHSPLGPEQLDALLVLHPCQQNAVNLGAGVSLEATLTISGQLPTVQAVRDWLTQVEQFGQPDSAPVSHSALIVAVGTPIDPDAL